MCVIYRNEYRLNINAQILARGSKYCQVSPLSDLPYRLISHFVMLAWLIWWEKEYDEMRDRNCSRWHNLFKTFFRMPENFVMRWKKLKMRAQCLLPLSHEQWSGIASVVPNTSKHDKSRRLSDNIHYPDCGNIIRTTACFNLKKAPKMTPTLQHFV